MKIAIVYDWMDSWGGVERVLLTLHNIFPTAEFYTSYWDKQNTSWARKITIKESFIGRLPKFIKRNRLLSLLLYPLAFESFDFTEFDVVLSVTSSFAKGIITKGKTKHICYMLTPPRYLWGMTENYLPKSLFKRLISAFFLKNLRKWDFVASRHPDKIIAISKTVQKRIAKYYRLDSELLYPPFDIGYWKRLLKNEYRGNTFTNLDGKKFYLIVSRLVPYKLVHRAFGVFNNDLTKNLVIVGNGTEEKKLKKIAGSNIFFYKSLTDQELSHLYSRSMALIMMQEEDFGYTALEAQALGCPVITYEAGGGGETVLDHKSGIHLASNNASDLEAALATYETELYNIRKYLEGSNVILNPEFGNIHFSERIQKIVNG